MNVSKLWAHQPTAPGRAVRPARARARAGSLTLRQRGILVTACASTLGDSYCSLAWGKKLAGEAGAEVAAGVLRGDDARARPVGAGAGPLGSPDHPRSQRQRGRRRPGAARRRLRRCADLRDHGLRRPSHRLLHRQRRAGRTARSRSWASPRRPQSATPSRSDGRMLLGPCGRMRDGCCGCDRGVGRRRRRGHRGSDPDAGGDPVGRPRRRLHARRVDSSSS